MHIPFISDAFGYLFKFLYDISFNNYLLALFLFALIIKLLLFPLGIKQQKNSIKQARLRPKEMAIRNKYKGRNDKATQQKQSEEIMKLYQEENFNPMGGCLPLLLQMPVLFALYDVIRNPMTYILRLDEDIILKLAKAVKLTGATKFANINQIDLINKVVSPKNAEVVEKILPDTDKAATLVDSFMLFDKFDLTVVLSDAFKSGESWKSWAIYLIIPVLTFVFSFFSTKIIRKFTYQPQEQTQDPSSKASLAIMDFMMPLMSVWISTIVSGAIGVYWMFQNILSVVQQLALYKMFPIPAVTEAEIKEAELQLKGKSSKNKNKPVVLSDNDIDDYDKTVKETKSEPKKNNKKKESVLSSRKSGISPKVKERIKETGRPLKARRKI